MTGQQLWEEAKLALRRLRRGDLHVERATDAERAVLAASSPPVSDPLAQDYAAWRRSLLAVAAIVLWALVLCEAIGFSSTRAELESAGEAGRGAANTIGDANLETIDGLRWLIIGSLAVGTIYVTLAARRWARPAASRVAAIVGFLVIFLSPFVLATIPVQEVLNLPTGEAERGLTLLVAKGMGLYYVVLIAPRVFALFPGIIRSALSLKTVLPESPMPGWTAMFTAPLFATILFVIFAVVNQIFGNVILVLAIASVLLGMVVIVVRGRRLVPPLEPDVMSRELAALRLRYWSCIAAASVFFLIFAIDAKAPFFEIVKIVLSLLGNVVLMTVVASDFLLGIVRKGHDQTRMLLEGDSAAPLAQRLDSLSAAGFTGAAGAAKAAEPVKAK